MDIRYIDTRGLLDEPFTFSEAVVKGIAPGGGLFVPASVPSLDIDEIVALGELPYAQRAARIYRLFGVDFSEDEIDALMAESYGERFDTPDVCPVHKVTDDISVLELWHGPTSAFKDMALQCLPVFFSASVEKQRSQGLVDDDYLIAVATSGDTGKAALQGFAERRHTSIIVFYPDGGVSDIQYKQMVTQEGANVDVCGVRGNFDDCQTSVKRMFADEAFNEKLHSEHGVKLSSANSINWGRLLPQVVYYISSYAQMVADGTVEAGNPIDVCVPTGNFGNILASWYAKKIGTPIDRILCASNENRVLTDFIETGTYDISDREFILTPSPSMDILVSSNLERQLFEFSGRDAQRIRTWMSELNTKGRFSIDEETFAALREHYRASSVDNRECLETIREVFETYGYLIDPHTAVAWKVGERLKGTNPLLIASTAHWAKFGMDVYRALSGIPAGEALPAEVADMTGPQLNREVLRIVGEGTVPSALSCLDEKEIRFTQVIDGQTEALEDAVGRALERFSSHA